jgi:hypothetical protein
MWIVEVALRRPYTFIAQLASVRRDRAQLEHAIAVLLGVMPSTFGLQPTPLASSVPVIDSGLPTAPRCGARGTGGSGSECADRRCALSGDPTGARKL